MFARARSVLSASSSPVYGEGATSNSTMHKQAGANPAIATTKKPTSGRLFDLHVFSYCHFRHVNHITRPDYEVRANARKLGYCAVTARMSSRNPNRPWLTKAGSGWKN